jgi:hypothetical protein
MLSHVAFAFEDPVPRQLEMKLGWIRLLAREPTGMDGPQR